MRSQSTSYANAHANARPNVAAVPYQGRDRTYDQASGLRALMVPQSTPLLVVAAAHELAVCHDIFLRVIGAATHAGHRVMLLDGTRAELAPWLNVRVRYELLHWLEGNKTFNEVAHVLPTFGSLRYLPAYRGLRALTEVTNGIPSFLQTLHHMPDAPDFVVAQGGPNLLPQLALLAASCRDKNQVTCGEIIWRVIPRPDVITATYLQLKKMARDYPHIRHRIWLHGVMDAQMADHVFANLADTAREFLGVVPHYLGYTPWSDAVRRAATIDIETSAQQLAHFLFQPVVNDENVR